MLDTLDMNWIIHVSLTVASFLSTIILAIVCRFTKDTDAYAKMYLILKIFAILTLVLALWGGIRSIVEIFDTLNRLEAKL